MSVSQRIYLSPCQTPAAPVLKRANKKRKEPEDYTSATPPAGPSTKRGKNEEAKQPRSKNTAVYVTNLPVDTEVDEIVERFGRFGVIEEDDQGEAKVKLYATEDGTFSGEALVVFFKEESVTLAISLLDETELRLGEPSTVMKVQRAEFKHKHTGTGTETNGNAQPRRTVDKKKASRRIGRMQK
jgi:HIV Tat-specific factor 1